MVDYLEALERLAMTDELHIKECKKLGISLTEDYEVVKQALLELQSIKEANPSEALEAFGRITLHTEYDNDSTYDGLHFEDDCKLVDKALERLEQIDNANPSEALKCLEYLIKECVGNDKYVFEPQLEIIKQALLKTQEPKKYLKWEDLDFSKELKFLNVRMNNNDYILHYTLDTFGNKCCSLCNKCCFLYDSAIRHHIDLTRQFFNDLHLEVLE